MLDTKKMLQNGFNKSQIVLVIINDRNGKEHIIAVDTLEHAKEYSGSPTIRLCTMYSKEDN